MKHSNKHDLVTGPGGVSYTALRTTLTMPPGPDWVESVVSGAGFFPVPEVPDPIPGRDGVDGAPGADGKDAELIFAGEWRRNRTYAANSVVTHEGSSYIAKVETSKEPPGKSWQLLAAAGADGKDGEAGPAGRGPRGLPGDSAPTSSQLNMVSSEGVQAGMAVSATHNGNYFARASSLGPYPSWDVIGLAAQTAAPGHACKVAFDRLTLKDWSNALEDGSSVLEPGNNYCLSRILGKLTTTSPQTGVLVSIGLAISETTLLLNVDNVIQWDKPVLATLDSTGVKGQFVSVAEGGHIDLALAAEPWPNYAFIGSLRDDCNAGDEASVHIGGGCLTLPDWSGVTEDGASVLIEDDAYWLSTTSPGKITNVEPIDTFFVGRAKSPTQLDVKMGKTKFTLGVKTDCGCD